MIKSDLQLQLFSCLHILPFVAYRLLYKHLSLGTNLLGFIIYKVRDEKKKRFNLRAATTFLGVIFKT